MKVGGKEEGVQAPAGQDDEQGEGLQHLLDDWTANVEVPTVYDLLENCRRKLTLIHSLIAISNRDVKDSFGWFCKKNIYHREFSRSQNCRIFYKQEFKEIMTQVWFDFIYEWK